MKINGVELEFDAFDAEQIEKIENLAHEIDNVEIPADATWSEVIRIRCNEVFRFFDEVFGEGTSYDLFGNKANLRVCQETLADFMDQAKIEMDETKTSIDKRFSKYAPNRAQRRTKK